jgi:hypothetical protein
VSNKNLSIPEEFAFDQLAIDNALANPTLLNYLAEVGYVEDRLKAGRSLLQQAMDLHQQQGGEYGDQHGATDAKGAAWDAANKAYLTQLKLARIAVKNRGDRDRLKLDGDRKQKFAEWRDQVEAFYSNALKDAALQTRLLEVNLTLAKLTAAYDLVKAVDAARQSQSTERGEAQDATDNRDAALDELRDWMSDYIAAAHVALEDHPQLLEVLGILARSTPAAHSQPKPTEAATPAA